MDTPLPQVKMQKASEKTQQRTYRCDDYNALRVFEYHAPVLPVLFQRFDGMIENGLRTEIVAGGCFQSLLIFTVHKKSLNKATYVLFSSSALLAK